jgi:hypothetical protein
MALCAQRIPGPVKHPQKLFIRRPFDGKILFVYVCNLWFLIWTLYFSLTRPLASYPGFANILEKRLNFTRFLVILFIW